MHNLLQFEPKGKVFTDAIPENWNLQRANTDIPNVKSVSSHEVKFTLHLMYI